jgi:sporulation protein YlmC with PRC-barrel domain
LACGLCFFSNAVASPRWLRHNLRVKYSVRSVTGWKILHDDQLVGTVSDVLFYTETGKMACVRSQRRRFFDATRLFFEDKTVRLKTTEAIKKQGEDWLGYTALNAKGQRIGSVYDLEFSPAMMVITRVVVSKKFLFIPISRHYFPFERIIDVRRKTVVFNTDTAVPVEKMIISPQSAVMM